MILTDASHMVGMTCMMKRSEMLPRAIAAGCDMFLFFNDMDEDFGYMMDGYKNGVITEERLQEALELSLIHIWPAPRRGGRQRDRPDRPSGS